jgi:hypothetical protein
LILRLTRARRACFVATGDHEGDCIHMIWRGNTMTTRWITWKILVVVAMMAIPIDSQGFDPIQTSPTGLIRKTSFRKRLGTPHTSFLGRTGGFPSLQPSALEFDSDGRLFVGTRDRGLLLLGDSIAAERDIASVIDADKQKEVQAIHCLLWDSKRACLWIGANGGLFSVKRSIDSYDLTRVDALRDTIVLSLALDRDNGLWIGTSRGLFDPSLTRYTTQDGLLNDIVQSLAIDSTGLVWIGTSRGLQIRNGTTFHLPLIAGLGPQGDEKEPVSAWVYGIAEDRDQDSLVSDDLYQVIMTGLIRGVHKAPAEDPEKEVPSPSKWQDWRTETIKLLETILEKRLNRQRQSRVVMVGTTEGVFRFLDDVYRGEKISPAWITAVTVDSMGQSYAAAREGPLVSCGVGWLSLFGWFDLMARVRLLLACAMLDEIDLRVEPGSSGLLNMSEIEDARTMSPDAQEEWVQERARSHAVTSMTFSPRNALFLGVDRAGLFRIITTAVVGDLFSSALLRGKMLGLARKWFFVNTPRAQAPPHPEIIMGRAMCVDSYFNFQSYKKSLTNLWEGRVSQLRQEDWNRLAPILGQYANPGSLIQFVEILHNDPYIFIPMISLEDARLLVNEGSIQLEFSIPPTAEQIDILEAQDLPTARPATHGESPPE